jgi:RNA polymerase sigma-70 factor (ECF subfamily)
MEDDAEREARLLHLPADSAPAAEVALDELELIYAYFHVRVGNRPDAEDLTQQVALKAIPRLRAGATAGAIRSYLFATARSVQASFWATRFGLPEEELKEDLWWGESHRDPIREPAAVEKVQRILEMLPANYRRLLELRFLRGYSMKEVAAELRTTIAGAKVMQLRALRAAAKVASDA